MANTRSVGPRASNAAFVIPRTFAANDVPVGRCPPPQRAAAFFGTPALTAVGQIRGPPPHTSCVIAGDQQLVLRDQSELPEDGHAVVEADFLDDQTILNLQDQWCR